MLLDNLEGYYGARYNDVQRQVLTGYLLDSDPREYEALYAQVLKVKLYGKPLPLVEHFEEAHDAVRAARPVYVEYRPQIEAETCMDREEIAEGLAEWIEKIRRKGQEATGLRGGQRYDAPASDDEQRGGERGGMDTLGEGESVWRGMSKGGVE